MAGETEKTAKPASEKRMGNRYHGKSIEKPAVSYSDGGPELLCNGSIVKRFCSAVWSKHPYNQRADENQSGASCNDIQLRNQVEFRDQAHVTPP